jgi:hypothetical protein
MIGDDGLLANYQQAPLCESDTPACRRMQSLPYVCPLHPQTCNEGPVTWGQNCGLTWQTPVISNLPHWPGLNEQKE